MKIRSLSRLALFAALVFGQWLAGPGAAWAQAAQSATESQVKAAFLFKFAGFTEWPAGSKASKVVAISVKFSFWRIERAPGSFIGCDPRRPAPPPASAR